MGAMVAAATEEGAAAAATVVGDDGSVMRPPNQHAASLSCAAWLGGTTTRLRCRVRSAIAEDDPDEAGAGVEVEEVEEEDGRSFFFSIASCARRECGSVRQARAGSTGPRAPFKASTTDMADMADFDDMAFELGLLLLLRKPGAVLLPRVSDCEEATVTWGEYAPEVPRSARTRTAFGRLRVR